MSLLFLISYADAAKLGISPAVIEFNMNSNERICQKAVLFSDSNETLIGETRWNSNKDFIKNLNQYNSDADDLNIKIEFPENIQVINKKDINICLTAKNSGKYFGALIYKNENKPAGIGVWVIANINGNEFEENRETGLIKLTGRVIENDEENNSNEIKTALIISTFFLLSYLVVLIAIKNRKKHGI